MALPKTVSEEALEPEESEVWLDSSCREELPKSEEAEDDEEESDRVLFDCRLV